MDRLRGRAPAGRLTAVLLLLLVLAATAGLLAARGPDSTGSDAERAAQINATLRCPTCQGLSIADSTSPMAGSMREMVAEQVAQGRTGPQIQQFFVERYSEWVLLTPPAAAGGWLLWLVPVVVVGVGAVAVLSLSGRVRIPRWTGGAGGSLAVLAVVVLVLQGNVGARGESGLVTGGDAATTSVAPTAAAGETRLSALAERVAADPGDLEPRLAYAAEALLAARPEITREQAEVVLRARPDDVEALLLLGLTATGSEDDAAVAALERFDELAPPDHPGRVVATSLQDQLAAEAR